MESNHRPKNVLFSFLSGYRKIKKFTDVKVKIGNKEMDAHRMVLEEASPVIKKMLEPQWFNGISLEFKEENVDPEVLEDLLNFFYAVPIEITIQNAFSLCIASDFLHIPNLIKKCETFLCQNISFENVYEFYNLSKNLRLELLRKDIGKFLLTENKNIPKNHDILSLEFDEIKEFLKEMISEFTKHIDQENIFHIIISWAEYDLKSRETLYSKLFEFFSLEKLSDALLVKDALSRPLIKKSFSCSEFFQKVLKEISSVSQTSGSSRLYILRHSLWDNSSSISYINLMNGKRRTAIRTAGQKALYITSYAVIGKKIYFSECYFESKKEVGYCRMLKVFDCENNTSSTLCRMPFRGDWYGYGMTALNGFLFVSGGRSRYDSLHSNVFRYSPFTNTWTEMKQMNEARYEHSLIPLNGLIYAIGEFEAGENMRTMECYNPATNEWKYVTPFGLDRFSMIATSHQNKIYALGRDNFKMFDPELNTWQDLTLHPHQGVAKLVSINDKLLYMKCFDTKDILEFNTTNNSWSSFQLFHFESEYFHNYEFIEPVVVNFS